MYDAHTRRVMGWRTSQASMTDHLHQRKKEERRAGIASRLSMTYDPCPTPCLDDAAATDAAVVRAGRLEVVAAVARAVPVRGVNGATVARNSPGIGEHRCIV